MNLQKILESRLKEMRMKRKRLVESWAPYVDAVKKFLKEKEGRELGDFEEYNIAQCIENAVCEQALRGKSTLLETTTGDNVEFMAIQLPVIAALVPSLVLNDVAIVQALDRRQGAVFFLDVLYGTNKGAVTAGSTMISATTGHDRTRAGRLYAVTTVENEALGSGAVGTTITGTLNNYPMLGTVVITDGTETFNDSVRPGQLVSSITGNPAGWVNDVGLFSVTFQSAPTSGGAVLANYCYNYDTADSGNPLVPEVNVNMRSEMLTAQDFPLRARYSLGASIDLEKAHGINLENELVKYLGGEVKFAIDQYGLDLLLTAAAGAGAATPVAVWNAAPAGGQEWLWKKYEFLDRIELGSNNIFNATLRANCNFIIAGNNVARVIRQMSDHFKAEAGLGKNVPTGPFRLGMLDNRLVIQNPFQNADTYVLGYRGANYLFAGAIFAPYIPLFATPTLITSDLIAQKGFLSSAGFRVINAGMYTYGTINMTGMG